MKTSLDKCKRIGIKDNYTEEEWESFEALCSRFGRAIDIFIGKVLRSLDELELEETTTKLDMVIRAEKRGFVENADLLIAMKDLRNDIVHEYIQELLKDKFAEVLEDSEILVSIRDTVYNYCKRNKYI